MGSALEPWLLHQGREASPTGHRLMLSKEYRVTYKKGEMLDLRLTVLRDSWNPAGSEPQPRASHPRSSPCPCLAPVPTPPLPFSASQHIFHSPTLRLRPSSRVWYTQLGVKAAALLRISETRATNTAVATSFWTVIADCHRPPAGLCAEDPRLPVSRGTSARGFGQDGGRQTMSRMARGHHHSFSDSTLRMFLVARRRTLRSDRRNPYIKKCRSEVSRKPSRTFYPPS